MVRFSVVNGFSQVAYLCRITQDRIKRIDWYQASNLIVFYRELFTVPTVLYEELIGDLISSFIDVSLVKKFYLQNLASLRLLRCSFIDNIPGGYSTETLHERSLVSILLVVIVQDVLIGGLYMDYVKIGMINCVEDVHRHDLLNRVVVTVKIKISLLDLQIN